MAVEGFEGPWGIIYFVLVMLTCDLVRWDNWQNFPSGKNWQRGQTEQRKSSRRGLWIEKTATSWLYDCGQGPSYHGSSVGLFVKEFAPDELMGLHWLWYSIILGKLVTSIWVSGSYMSKISKNSHKIKISADIIFKNISLSMVTEGEKRGTPKY